MIDIFGEDLGTLPDSDPVPEAEPPIHQQTVRNLQHALDSHFEKTEEVFVGCQLPLFYQKGDRSRYCNVDLLVALRGSNRLRENYKVWGEGGVPDFILEVTSAATKFEDFGEKRGLYSLLGVREYCLFDPQGDYLDPPLRLYSLQGEDYQRVLGDPLVSETLGLELHLFEGTLRFKVSGSEQLLPTIADTRTGFSGEQSTDSSEPSGLSQEELDSSEVVPSEEAERLATEIEEMRRL